jgi:hypothetical protein
MNFSGRSTFLIVSESSMTVSCIKKVTHGQKRSWNGRKRSCNGRKRPGMVNGCNADWSGNFETERCNALDKVIFTEGSPNLSADRVRTVPYRTVRTVPCVPYRAYRTVRTVPCVPYRAYRTVRTVPCVPYRAYRAYRTVPYRFPRGTVLIDREAYRTFLTVFRDF